MKRKERYIARLDEVVITREGDYAIIRYKEDGIMTTHLGIGPEIATMTDQEILDRHNECLRARAELAASYRHVAVEVPLGSPQIEYEPRSRQWVPRGNVLRCLISDRADDDTALVEIDDHELDAEAFSRMLTVYAGWGMRIEFVPDDQTPRRPAHEVREPDPKG
ncbi:MAG: DUF7713 domain-containing protein [Opitutaceae bacterium]